MKFMLLSGCAGGCGAVRLGTECAEELWEDFKEIVPGGTDIGGADGVLSGIGIDSLLELIVSSLGGAVGGAFAFLAMLLGLSMLLALSETVCDGGRLGGLCTLGVGTVSALAIFRSLSPLCAAVEESLSTLSSFFSSLIPVMTGISAAAGGMNTAATEALNMNITLGIVAYLSDRLLMPLVFAMLVLSSVSALDGGGISSLAKSVRGLFMWGLGIATTVILGTVSLQSVLASAKDTAYLRAAKYAASGIIPVVGGTVSSALGSLGGALSYIKGAVGAASVFVMASGVLSPLLTLLLYRLSLSLSISFLEFVGSTGGVRVFSSFRGALDALTAVYSISTIIYICEVVIFMKSGVSAFG